jgi:hypothetical protein
MLDRKLNTGVVYVYQCCQAARQVAQGASEALGVEAVCGQSRLRFRVLKIYVSCATQYIRI